MPCGLSAHSAVDSHFLSPQPRYAHDGRWYVEARKGREYAIRLRNPYPVHVAVALSVDGLNTIDARESTAADARKWVLGPYETVTISGWQTRQTEARRFEFTTEERSYGQALGKTANLGIVSAVFFKERVPTFRPDTANEHGGARMPAPQPSAPAERDAPASAADARAGQPSADEYAATGMGRRTGHAVQPVWLALEDAPAQAVHIRSEFRPQRVRLGILPPAAPADRLQPRERARGFEPGFCPRAAAPTLSAWRRRGLYYGRAPIVSSLSTSRVSTLAAASRAVARCVARHPDIQAAYIFGSVAQGRARPDSDIDVGVLLGRRLPDARALRYRLTLADELGAALHRNDVQLVILNDAPPLLAQRVLSQGVLVFQRSRAARVRFHVATAQRYDDMVPTMERYVDRLKQHVTHGRAGG
jgi:predicted nucleotidyltransferase